MRDAALTIRGATVYDGTGRAARRADVAVANGRIGAVGSDLDAVGRVIDGAGLAVAPGFIDFHSHADLTLPAYPDAVNSISQGVTTELVGNCGFSPAPIASEPARAEELRAVCAGLGPDLDWSWSSFRDYLRVLDEARPTVNCAALVGHNALRIAAMGMEDRAPDPTELGEMRALLDDALQAGAWGVSTGLIYAPGTFSDIDELAALGAVAARHGALYASHVRNEGDDVLAAVEEALEVGRRTGVTVQVSHLKATGVGNFGRIGELTGAIDAARAAGVRAHADAYPYTAGSTFLAMVLPPWVHEGGPDEIVRRLESADLRARIRAEMEQGLPGWNSLIVAAGGWDRILVSSVNDPTLADHQGVTIAELAARRGADPHDLTFDVLVADRAAATMVIFLMDEADVRGALAYPGTVVGSDQLRVTSRRVRTHPRAYGTFARVLGHYVREEDLVTLPDAIHRMTGLPASILGFTDRGLVAPGMVADLVLFDPERIADRADYDEPTRLADGVEAVLLGGRVAFAAGETTTPGLGRVLRRGESREA